MLGFIARYTNWLHTRWPAGRVEKLPEIRADGTTSIPGVRVVGDLTGIPLLKFSADTGARAVQAILEEPGFRPRDLPGDGGAAATTHTAQTSRTEEVLDLAIVGGGVSGIAAALEAHAAGLRFQVYEAVQPFSTIVNFPKAKPIYTYPTSMTPAGRLQVRADVKESLLEELESQRRSAGIAPVQAHIQHLERSRDAILLHGDGHIVARARRVIVAIGRSGNYRKLGIPGETLDKVFNRLYDPKDHADQQVLVVGGGDSALETAIALCGAGAHVTLSYRGEDFSRPKPENLSKLRKLEHDPASHVGVEMPVSERVTTAARAGTHPSGSLRVLLGSHVKEIRGAEAVVRDREGRDLTLANDVVFVMIGRGAPLDFFRRSGIPIHGEWRARQWLGLGTFLAFCTFLYNWKLGGGLTHAFEARQWFPFNVPGWMESVAASAANPASFLGTLRITLAEPSFYYSLAYSLCIVLFGIDRLRRRKTPYVRLQTLVLMAVQVLPLFLLPYVLLPWAGHNGAFDSGAGKWLGDQLFPIASYGHGREYWRAFGLVLAWPLFVWNFFTEQPLWLWLAIGALQTFVVIPWIVWRWGKGAYCGWVCSCGALAETMGDRHRHKMPHGMVWNRLNMLGQGILAVAVLLFVLRIIGWAAPGSNFGRVSSGLFHQMLSGFAPFGVQLNYWHVVDLMLAGILGVGLYFWFSGRVWCRFACPLAALMHIYARFSRYRIFAEKSKCISCNVCTSVCHQGIDVMNFANKGLPMEDPECVRCSACVQMCPTGVLRFGRFASDGRVVFDVLPASPVRAREG
jgi:NosR/NirI family transcriptional regulator, nitrous oxide reductase regulator